MHYSNFLLLLLLPLSLCKRQRHLHKPDYSRCKDPPHLKEQLAEWLSESAEGTTGNDWIAQIESDDDWSPSGSDAICDAPLDTSTNSNVMQRSLCPWTWRASFDDSREPKMISEASCQCRRSRGTSGSYCMPIKRDTPILRRERCNTITGYWEYSRAKVSTTVGCHSVLPRTQRTTRLAGVDNRDVVV